MCACMQIMCDMITSCDHGGFHGSNAPDVEAVLSHQIWRSEYFHMVKCQKQIGTRLRLYYVCPNELIGKQIRGRLLGKWCDENLIT